MFYINSESGSGKLRDRALLTAGKEKRKSFFRERRKTAPGAFPLLNRGRAFILCAVFTVLVAVVLAPLAHAGVNTPYNWYCKNNDRHEIPVLDECMKFIEKYNVIYADKNADDSDKVVYLTFDAGYENGNIEKVLDILDKNDVPATFFILENMIKRAPELVKRMADGGYTVANHTKSHPDMSAITDKALFERQLTALSDAYKELTGKDMAMIYRPPQGRFSEQNLEFADSLGYTTMFWSFAYADWDNNKQLDPQKALDKILSHLHNGEIMLLHPTSATNALILESLIQQIRAQGYRIGSVEELCGR